MSDLEARGRKGRWVSPDPEFVAELHRSCSCAGEVSRRCGVPHKYARRLLDGEPIPELSLLDAENCFRGGGDDSLKISMTHLMRGGPRLRDAVIGRLQQMARMTEEYYDRLHITDSLAKYYLFPPRDVISAVSNTLDTVVRQLKELHVKCPECDDVIFRYAPGLLARIVAEDSESGSKKS